MEKKSTKASKKLTNILKYKPSGAVLGIACAVLAFLCVVHLYVRTASLKQQNAELTEQVKQAKRVYVYNLEEVVVGAGVVAMQQDFEQKVKKLSDEVETAKKKISSLKDAKVKADFSEVYLNSLVLKRDEMLAEYEKSMKKATEDVNVALRQVAEKLDAPTIYHTKSVSVTTPYVVDVTKEVVDQLKSMNNKTEKNS